MRGRHKRHIRAGFSGVFGFLLGLVTGGVAVADIPETVLAYLVDPPKEALDSALHWGDGSAPPESVALLRRVVLAWDPTETGAPRFDPSGPFGAGLDALPQDLDQAKALVMLTHHVNIFTSRAVLTPGAYMPRNLAADAIRQTFAWLNADDAYLGLTDQDEVLVTADQIRLLREMPWEWPNEYDVEDVLGFGGVPAPATDAKRPYGAMSYYKLDVHRLQEWPVEKKTEDGYIALTDQQESDATRLHHQMFGVMQVFLENAVLPE